ncbi:MAG: ABC-2 family transporter protein [Candidatus Micrarchaeota archaeon]|nr:ABC-2 family transporter protein [Candidatus Micrarchaeota archaeon]
MIAKIKRDLHLLRLFQTYTWKVAMAYRVQYMFWFLNYALQVIMTLIFITIVYQVSNGIGGWSYPQMVLLSATTMIVIGIIKYFVDIGWVGQNLINGNFDTVLTKPIPSYLTFFISTNSSGALGGVISGVVLFAYAASQLSFGLLGIAEFAIMILLGSIVTLLFVMVMIMYSYSKFKGGGWINWMFNIIANITKYPLSIYGLGGSLIFTFVIPVGFANYYSVEALSGKLGQIEIAGLILVSLVMIFVLSRAVNSLFRNYSSGMG